MIRKPKKNNTSVTKIKSTKKRQTNVHKKVTRSKTSKKTKRAKQNPLHRVKEKEIIIEIKY